MARKRNKEEWKISGNVFDQFTNRALHFLSHNNYFDEITHTLDVGKESNVFLAEKEGSPVILVKIYRLENANFNKMLQYIGSDPRFPSIKPNKRDIIFAWVQREYRNLLVARQAGVRVPTVYINKAHILVEEFIGDELKPAPQLKNTVFETEEEVQNCFDDIVEQMRLLYHKAKLVHGDLSDFNILYHEEKPVLIDFSQATSVEDYHANEYLQRDCKNISRFFNKFGMEIDENELFEKVKENKKE